MTDLATLQGNLARLKEVAETMHQDATTYYCPAQETGRGLRLPLWKAWLHSVQTIPSLPLADGIRVVREERDHSATESQNPANADGLRRCHRQRSEKYGAFLRQLQEVQAQRNRIFGASTRLYMADNPMRWPYVTVWESQERLSPFEIRTKSPAGRDVANANAWHTVQIEDVDANARMYSLHKPPPGGGADHHHPKAGGGGGGGQRADPFFRRAHDGTLTVAVVRDAVRRGVDLDADLPQRSDGVTALMRAATTAGSPRAVKYLIDSGAGVDRADGKGKTALMWAAQRGRPAMVKALLRRGADLGARDKKGRTALHYCTASSKKRGDSKKCARQLRRAR